MTLRFLTFPRFPTRRPFSLRGAACSGCSGPGTLALAFGAKAVRSMNPVLTRRSFTNFGVVAMLLSSMSGCRRNGNSKGAGVNGSKTELAATELAASITASMNRLRESAEGPADVYAVVLVVLDDFSDIQIYAN